MIRTAMANRRMATKLRNVLRPIRNENGLGSSDSMIGDACRFYPVLVEAVPSVNDNLYAFLLQGFGPDFPEFLMVGHQDDIIRLAQQFIQILHIAFLLQVGVKNKHCGILFPQYMQYLESRTFPRIVHVCLVSQSQDTDLGLFYTLS